MMTVTKVILISAGTSLVLLSLLFAFGWNMAHQRMAEGSGGMMHARHMRGMWFAGSGGGNACARLTDEHVAEHVEQADDWLVAELDLTDDQRDALAPVLAAGSDWVIGMRALCATETSQAPETLAMLSGLTGLSDRSVKQLVGAFDSFYAGLNEAQRTTLDEWLRWPHPHALRHRRAHGPGR